jgi:phage terminase small subunit
MTNKEKLFIKHYAKCREAKEAAILAGFKEGSAKVTS